MKFLLASDLANKETQNLILQGRFNRLTSMSIVSLFSGLSLVNKGRCPEVGFYKLCLSIIKEIYFHFPFNFGNDFSAVDTKKE